MAASRIHSPDVPSAPSSVLGGPGGENTARFPCPAHFIFNTVPIRWLYVREMHCMLS